MSGGLNALTQLIEQSRPRIRTASAVVLDTLRLAILRGDLKAGEALKQDALAAAFGVSRMPVREALRHLEAEGLVEFIPNCGATVAKTEPVDIAGIFEVRSLLEPYAIRNSVPNLGEEDLRRAGEILDEIDREQDIAKWGELNRRFHLTLYAGLPRRPLIAVIDAQYRAVDRYVRFLLSALDYVDRSQDEHREILRCCADGDGAGAEQALAEHLREGVRQLVAFVSRQTA